MNRIHKLLNELATPKTLRNMDQRLGEICDAMATSKGIKPEYRQDHTVLTDFMMYVEMALGEKSLLEVNDEYPKTDPLSMISTAERYKVITPEQATNLRGEFMARANAAAGTELTAAQTTRLFQFFREYDPVRELKLKP